MATITCEQHDINSINFVNGLSDPGEMIACGAHPELRRHQGEQDAAYAERIRPLVMVLPQKERDIIMTAAIRRAGLDTSNGRVSVVVAGQPAWHGLGVTVEGVLHWEEAMRLANMDWAVEEVPLFGHRQVGDTINHVKATDRKMLLRSDTGEYLNTVGANYKVLQNKASFNFMDAVIGSEGAEYESAGVLGGGESIWLLVRLPDEIRLDKDDLQKCYALLTNGHGTGEAVNVLPTSVRVCCKNTKRIALNSADSRKLSIRHTGDIKSKIKAAQECLGLVKKTIKKFEHSCQALASVSLKDSQVTDYLESMYPTVVKPKHLQKPLNVDGASLLESILDSHGQEKDVVSDLLCAHYAETERIANRNKKILEQILDNYHSPESKSAKDTAWGVYNAVSRYVDNGKNYKNEEVRTKSILLGAGDAQKEEAFEKAMAFVAK